ncbi:MAG: hypothetical protein IPL83_15155 [Bdellovibrionales bacterium]|nr:hypothetical protein [Bdellovibrionales bacterium]
MVQGKHLQNLILVTGTAVIALGGVAWSTLHPPKIDGTEIQTKVNREPTGMVSVVESSHLLTVSDQIDTINIDCLVSGLAPEIETQARQVRLVGRLCQTESKEPTRLENPQIVNQTNGFLATVFVPQTNLFTSDYIYLTIGKNQFLISWEENGKSKLSSNFSLVRRSINNSKTVQ